MKKQNNKKKNPPQEPKYISFTFPQTTGLGFTLRSLYLLPNTRSDRKLLYKNQQPFTKS